MKAVSFYCAVAMLFYALEIAITDWKLSNVSPRLLTLFYAIGVAACAGTFLLIEQKQVIQPCGKQWIFIVFMIVSSFIAASAHFQALHEKSGAVMLTMYYCLLPVAASFFAALFKWEFPNFRTAAAWLIATIALYLLSTGNK